jgi:hypothetical protein
MSMIFSFWDGSTEADIQTSIQTKKHMLDYHSVQFLTICSSVYEHFQTKWKLNKIRPKASIQISVILATLIDRCLKLNINGPYQI